MFLPAISNLSSSQLKELLRQLRVEKFKAEYEAIQLNIKQEKIANMIELGRNIGRIENELYHRGEDV